MHYRLQIILVVLCLQNVIYTNEMDEHEIMFTTIYDNAAWGINDEGLGFSGGGSLLKNTRIYIRFLEHFIRTHDVKTIVDAGCGDWEFSRSVNWQGARYYGYDVVASVIERNIARYASDKIVFVHANFLTEELPSADLLICKHVLQHLPNDDIMLFLKQIRKFKYCLITNAVFPQTLSSDGADTHIGGGHKIDLTLPPFNIKGSKVLNYTIENDTTIQQIFLIDNSASFQD